MNRRLDLGAALLAIALAVPLAMPSATAATGAPLEWWGPKGIHEGFHLRVPVTVTNPHPYPLTNAPVAAELDLGAKLLAAGWTSSAGGDRDVLSGFRLDDASIRVVSMTNLQPADNVNGRLLLADSTFPADDDRRFEVPSTHVQGFLSGGAPFDAALNPAITVLWRVPGTLAPGDERHFVVYFDSDRTSAPKPPRDDGLTLADGDLRSLFWSGPSLVSFGYVVPAPGQPGRIQVTSLHADTVFQVFVSAVGPPGSPPGPLQPLPSNNAFTLGPAHATLQLPVTTTGPVAVKVVANKPVVVQGASAGFVPALDGGMTGREFLFYTVDAPAGQDTLYVTAVDPRDDDGILEKTVVEVTAVGTGRPPLMYETRSDGSPFHYTIGPRAAMEPGGGACRDGGATPYLAPGTNVQAPPPALYRAVVKSGERVQLQLLTATGVTQVPSALGAPMGQAFWPALPFSEDVPGRNSLCATVVTVPAVWTSSALGPGRTGNVTSPEVTYQVSPPGAPSPPGPPNGRYPPPQALPQAPAFSPPLSVAGRPAADRPLLLATSGDAVALAGVNPQGGGPPPAHGPWGGDDAGRTFVGNGRSLVFAPYPGTLIGGQVQHAQGTGTLTLPVATGTYAVLDDASSQNPLRGFRAQSNRPVLVTPTALSTSFFSGVPAMLAAVAGPAEYRGYLLDLASSNGLDPLTGSTPPGVSLTHSLRLTNRAKALDGSLLPDLVQVTAKVPAGWEATLDGVTLSASQGPTYSLKGGEPRPLQLVVSPPAGLPSGSSGTVSLLAQSQNNELVQDPLDVVTFVKTVHDVGLWFDAVDGAKQQENRTMSLAGVANFTLVVQNQGSKGETIRLGTQFKAGETTWAVRVGGPDGKGQMDLVLGPRQSARVPLSMQAPAGLVDGEATVVVTAEVPGVSNSKDAVQATAARRAPADLSLAAEGLTRVVPPGQDATFNLTLRNSGAGAANVQLGVRSGPGAAWGTPRVLVAGVPTPDVAVDAGGSVRVQVVVPASPAGLGGQSVTLRFAARPEGGTGALEAVLTGVVAAVHRVQVGMPPLPLALSPGSNATVELRLGNAGNVDEDLLIRPGSLPPGWRLGGASMALVPRGATVPVRLDLEVPASLAPMRDNVTIELVSRDGNATRVTLPSEVGLGTAFVAEAASPRPVQPGRIARLDVPAANEGNTPLVVRVAKAPEEAWELAPGPALRLLPGERTTLTIGWLVPKAAPDGASVHRAVLSLEPEGLEASTRPIEATFDVGRPDLEAVDVQSASGPAGRLVHAIVRNAGDRPALGFAVSLVVDGETLDRQLVGELRPGDEVAVALLQSRPGAATVLLDANATVSESDESDNELAVAGPAPRQAPLGALAPALAVSLAVAAALRRRRA